MTEAEYMELGEALHRFIGVKMRNTYVVDGTVVAGSVDADPSNSSSKWTCSVKTTSGSIYTNVPIRVLVGSQASLVEVPADGSACELYWRNGNFGRPQAQKFDQIKKVYISAGDTEQGVIFNGGQNGGLVFVNNLVSRLNILEQDINILKKAFSTWSPVAMDGGAALKAAAAVWYAQQLTETVANDVENKAILQ